MKKIILLVTALILTSSSLFAQGFEEIPGISPMNIARYGHAAETLPDGRVLVVGGLTEGNLPNPTAEIYNPGTNEWTLYHIDHPHFSSSYVKLNNGNYMFFGGYSAGFNSEKLNTTTIFDPVTTTFTSGPPMNIKRASSSAVVLKDNRVLIVGSGNIPVDPAEIFDPITNTFTTIGSSIVGSSSLIFPCNDGSAILVQGSYIVYFDPITNDFALWATQLFSYESGWEANWKVNSGQLSDLKLSNGSYFFMMSKRRGNDYREYTFARFDPEKKEFFKLLYSPEITLIGGFGQCLWGYTDNTMIKHPDNDDFYFFGGNIGCSPSHTKLNRYEYPGRMYIPEGQLPFNFQLDLSSKTWVNGNLLCTGGIGRGYVNPKNEVHLLKPKKTLATEENTDYSAIIQIAPNPVSISTFQIKTLNQEISTIEIFDMSGILVKIVKVNPKDRTHVINRDLLPNGVYLLKLKGVNGSITKKIIFN